MVELYFDGAVRPSNDDAAVGIFCKNSEGQVIERTFRITAENNHEAEFQAFLKAVELAEELVGTRGKCIFLPDGFRSRFVGSRTRVCQK